MITSNADLSSAKASTQLPLLCSGPLSLETTITAHPYAASAIDFIRGLLDDYNRFSSSTTHTLPGDRLVKTDKVTIMGTSQRQQVDVSDLFRLQ